MKLPNFSATFYRLTTFLLGLKGVHRIIGDRFTVINPSNFVGSLHLDIWESIDWRKVLKEITTRAYWNYQNALEIPLSDYVAPGTEHQDRIIATLCQLLKEAYNMNVDEQTHKVILEKKPSDV